MEIKPIKTDKDYESSLERLELIFDANQNSKEGDEAEIISIIKLNKHKSATGCGVWFYTS
jgi:HTH-type transcriptional regulator/antitoxin HigA